MNNTEQQLKYMSTVPQEPKEFKQWLMHKDTLPFLTSNSKNDYLIVSSNYDHLFLHSILVPNSLLHKPDFKDLSRWGGVQNSCYGIDYSYGRGKSEVCLSKPFADSNSKIVRQGEQLIFIRHFEDSIRPFYFEVAQKFCQSLNLHYIPETEKYRRIDCNGDIEDIVTLETISKQSNYDLGWHISIKRDVLDEYMVATATSLVCLFIFNRRNPKNLRYNYNQNEKTIIDDIKNEVHYQHTFIDKHSSEVSGEMIIRSNLSK